MACLGPYNVLSGAYNSGIPRADGVLFLGWSDSLSRVFRLSPKVGATQIGLPYIVHIYSPNEAELALHPK